MAKKDKIEAKINQLSDEPSGEKMMQAVVMSAGPGTRMLELTRSGPARNGIMAWVEGEAVVWLTTDRSALMPVRPGTLTATYDVSGGAGKRWRIRVTRPIDAVGGAGDELPPGGHDQGEFLIDVP